MDDLIYCRLPSDIHQSFETLLQLLTQLSLTINPNKLVAPSTSLTCLGFLINTETRTMSVPPDKLDSIIDMCGQWQNKTFCSKKAIRVIIRLTAVCLKMCKTCTYVS